MSANLKRLDMSQNSGSR